MDKEEVNKDELTELREMWAELNTRITRLEEETINEGRRVSNQRIKSAQEDLATTYKRFSRVSLCCAVIFPIIYGFPGVFQYPTLLYHIIVAAASFIFFCTAGIMDLYLTNGVQDIDIATMPVTEVRILAINLKKLHHIFQIILIPMAVVLLGVMCYPVIKQVWIGMIIGGIIGLSIGITAYLKMMRDYKEIIRS